MIKISKNTSARKVFLWNAIGSACNAFSTMVILMVINRFYGQFEGGIVTIALALAQQMLTISNFETATFYVTDGKKETGFSVHLSTKTILFIVAVIVSVAISLYKYDFYKAVIVICFCIYKATDGFATLTTGALQREGRLDLAGISLTFKTITSIVALIVVSLATKNLMLASILMVVVGVLWTLFIDLGMVACFLPIKFDFSIKKITKLIFDCAPLFLTIFLFTYIINQPKYVIDSFLTEESQNAFGIIFLPSAVITMLSLFIYRPMLTTLTNYWSQNERKKFFGLVIKVSLILLGLTAICVVGGAVLGVPILSLIFGVDLNGMEIELGLIIIGGGLYAFSTLLYNVLAIFRKQKLMLVACATVYVFAIVVTKPLTVAFNLNGASLSYALCNLMLSVLLLVCCLVTTKKKGVCVNG
ncbi:MAG: hypothetical protein IJN22_03620 [Clostridia bacterium]|nr:hypothetical protein [Clostridia bacterium]